MRNQVFALQLFKKEFLFKEHKSVVVEPGETVEKLGLVGPA